MDHLKQTTINTYNDSAPALAEFFQGIGPRSQDINYVFDLLGRPEAARVVEIGCGNGRDAKMIRSLTPYYLGFDISEKLVDLARQQVPEADFVVADAADFEFPDNLDAIFAFASLLHLDKHELEAVLTGAKGALKPGGIFYISLKHSPYYHSEIKQDRFGERLFYFYSEEDVRQMIEGYEVVKSTLEDREGTDWLEMALRRL